jgi:hypothetical protein
VKRDLLNDLVTFKPEQVGADPTYNAGQFTMQMLAAGVPMMMYRTTC